jgi:hypothetical protein
MQNSCALEQNQAYLPPCLDPPQGELFEPSVSSDLELFVAKAVQIAQQHPEILSRIEADQITHGLEKKARRVADQQYLQGQTGALFGMEASAIRYEPQKLEGGRPRMPAIVVFVFLLLRGWLGGPKTVDFALILRESITLRRFLSCLGLHVPGLSTVAENMNAVSAATLQLSLRCQLDSAKKQGLDDFDTVRIDSTAAAANSKYPTDSGLIAAFALRMCGLFLNLAKLGLPDLSVRCAVKTCAELARAIELFCKQIGLLSGKQRAEEKRNGLYRKIYSRVDRLVNRFDPLLDRAKRLAAQAWMLPSKRTRVQELISQAEEDRNHIAQIRQYSARRVLEELPVATDEKVLSLSDEDAAIIKKGGWDTVFGYRPQLAFSGKGLVTAHHVPRGNAADSGQLEQILKQVQENTRTAPKTVTVDDGYCNGPVRKAYLEAHSDEEDSIVFSIAGAKGKQVIDEATYESEPYRAARHDRSAAESCIYTLKAMHDYGEIMRRGLDSVEHEQMCKVLAYNIRRIIALEQGRWRNAGDCIGGRPAKLTA